MATWFAIMHEHAWADVARRNARIVSEVPAALWKRLLVPPAVMAAAAAQAPQDQSQWRLSELQQLQHARWQAKAALGEDGSTGEGNDAAGTLAGVEMHGRPPSPGFAPRPAMAAFAEGQPPSAPHAPTFSVSGSALQWHQTATQMVSPQPPSQQQASGGAGVTGDSDARVQAATALWPVVPRSDDEPAVFSFNPGPHDVRWCRKCSAVKPPRAHHCSLCGTCVLKMDHHCPWVRERMCFRLFPLPFGSCFRASGD
jgi:hypothetical protein